MFSIHLNHLYYTYKPAVSSAMSQKYLKFNTPKTEVMAISHPQT